jgi:hypothetical protein
MAKPQPLDTKIVKIRVMFICPSGRGGALQALIRDARRGDATGQEIAET